jgi:cardiolipin synthase
MRAANYSKSNQLTLLHRGAEFFPALIQAFDTAESEIYLETYIFAQDATADRVQAALNRAAQRGVQVYVIADWLGTGAARCTMLAQEFAATGVHYKNFNPWFRRGLARTHRKLVVVDGRLAFLGGLNINDDMLSDEGSQITLPWPRWDFAVSISGPLVAEIYAEAAAQWVRRHFKNLRSHLQNLRLIRSLRHEAAHQVAKAALVVRDNLRNRGTIQRNLLQALGRARHTAYFVTPYFAPGRKLRQALAIAAGRGVSVTLLIGVGQFRMQDAVAQSFYPKLSRAGVNIVEYRKTQLHGKVVVIDDEWATIGSSNFDGLSLFVNHEANIIVRDTDFAQALRKHIAQGVAEGVVISPSEVARLSWARRTGNQLAYFLYKSVLQLITAGKYTK